MNERVVRPRTAVVTGAPGAGKSAVLEVLAERGRRTVREAARAILMEPRGMAFRSDDPTGFASAMLERELADLEAAPDDGSWTIFDRGTADSLGFLRLSGLKVRTDLDARANALRYSGPIFIAPPWAEIYCADSERTQNWDEAVASGNAVAEAWADAGYRLIELPLESPEVRADFIEARLR